MTNLYKDIDGNIVENLGNGKYRNVTNSPHTPAPWYVSDTLQLYSEVTGNHIANLDTAMDKIPSDMLYANARLIAAAPILLDACLEARKLQALHVDDLTIHELNVIDALNAAIAKAIGE